MRIFTGVVFGALCFLGAALCQTQKPTPAPDRIPVTPKEATPTPTPVDYVALAAKYGGTKEQPTPDPVDCNKFGEPIPGCKSFNEMVANKDKDILSALTGPYRGYVCFRIGEDVFTVVSFQRPTPWGYQNVTGESGTVERLGVSNVTRYKQGNSESWKQLVGKWRKLESEPAEEATFEGAGRGSSPEEGKPSISIDPTEITFSYKWKNLANTLTSYTLQIRRSTKRFVETLERPPTPTEKEQSIFLINQSGHCEFYPNQQ